MRGKKVVVIVTKMDAFKGKQEARKDVRSMILSFFNVDMRPHLDIFMTSGHELYTMQKLQDFLDSHPDKDGDDLTDQLEEDADLFHDVGTYLGTCLKDSRQEWYDYVRERLEANLHEEIMTAFRDMYINSEKLALASHLHSLKGAHTRWEAAFGKLREFVEANDKQKEIIMKELKDITEAHNAVVNELSKLPLKLKDALEDFMKEHVSEALKGVAGTDM
jgi:hypothetical protein